MVGPMQLESYSFPLVELNTSQVFDFEKYSNKTMSNFEDMTIETQALVNKEQPGKYMVVLKIRIEPKDPERSPYIIKLDVVGFFNLSQDIPEAEHIIRINGSSILYSAAREFLLTVTSRAPWGELFLPTINFLAKPSKEAPMKTLEKKTSKGKSKRRAK